MHVTGSMCRKKTLDIYEWYLYNLNIEGTCKNRSPLLPSINRIGRDSATSRAYDIAYCLQISGVIAADHSPDARLLAGVGEEDMVTFQGPPMRAINHMTGDDEDI